MFKIKVTFYSIYCEIATTKNYGKFSSHYPHAYKTKWWRSHGIYVKLKIIVISNFLKLPLTFLEVAVFFLLEKQRLLNYNEKCLLNSFIHYYYFSKKKKTSHLTPGLGLSNILGKRQIRQFLGVKIQLYMPKSHLRVDSLPKQHWQ